MSFWENYTYQCDQHGLNPTTCALESGAVTSSGTVNGWKKGATPRADKRKKLADYLGVPIEYLGDEPIDRKTHWKDVAKPDEIDVAKYIELEDKVKKLESEFEKVQKKYAATQGSSANDSPERTEARRIVESVPEEQLEMLIRIWKAASGIS